MTQTNQVEYVLQRHDSEEEHRVILQVIPATTPIWAAHANDTDSIDDVYFLPIVAWALVERDRYGDNGERCTDLIGMCGTSFIEFADSAPNFAGYTTHTNKAQWCKEYEEEWGPTTRAIPSDAA